MARIACHNHSETTFREGVARVDVEFAEDMDYTKVPIARVRPLIAKAVFDVDEVGLGTRAERGKSVSEVLSLKVIRNKPRGEAQIVGA